MPKQVKKADKWKYKELSDEDKTHIKMAIACYLIASGQREKPPKYSIEVAREIIPYLKDEDAKWVDVDRTKVT